MLFRSREVLGAGADICVAGSAVFKKRSISDNISHFMAAFQEYEKKNMKSDGKDR